MFDRVDNHALKVAGVFVAAVVVGVAVSIPPSSEVPATSPLPVAGGAEPEPELILIHVSGEVASAGLVEVSAPARVADVVAAAGGVTPGADLRQVNLAEPVVDGQQIVIPSGDERSPQSDVAARADNRVHINDADPSSLEALPGVGPVLAGKIVAHRDEYGPFHSVENLLDVPGIGEKKLASLRDLVIVP